MDVRVTDMAVTNTKSELATAETNGDGKYPRYDPYKNRSSIPAITNMGTENLSNMR